MLLYFFVVFVAQICYCSASCTCPDATVPVPTSVAYLIGIIIPILLAIIVVLGLYVYRLRRGKNNEDPVFEVNRHASMIKYERQDCMDDDVDTLQRSQIKYYSYAEDGDADINTDETNETKPIVKKPNKIQKQIKVPIVPNMNQEHIRAFCNAVNKHPQKEHTSLSDLDKIVNEAKEEAEKKAKLPEYSASTPILDVFEELTSPVKVKKLPIFEANSKEANLRNEIMAKFNQKKNDNEINVAIHNEKITSLNNKKSSLKPDQDDISLNLIQHEKMPKIVLCELKSKLNHGKINPKNESEDEENEPAVEEIQDEIYDIPPPKPQSEIYDVLPSPKPQYNELPDFPTAPELDDELYDFPPSPKPHTELHNFPTSPRSTSELYDIKPLAKPLDEVYDNVPSTQNKNTRNDVYDSVPSIQNKKRVVSDGNDTGYLLALSDETILSNEAQYSNAKIAPNQNTV